MDPRWIAPLCTWLASPQSDGVTGQVFEVSGGLARRRRGLAPRPEHAAGRRPERGRRRDPAAARQGAPRLRHVRQRESSRPSSRSFGLAGRTRRSHVGRPPRRRRRSRGVVDREPRGARRHAGVEHLLERRRDLDRIVDERSGHRLGPPLVADPRRGAAGEIGPPPGGCHHETTPVQLVPRGDDVARLAACAGRGGRRSPRPRCAGPAGFGPRRGRVGSYSHQGLRRPGITHGTGRDAGHRGPFVGTRRSMAASTPLARRRRRVRGRSVRR